MDSLSYRSIPRGYASLRWGICSASALTSSESCVAKALALVGLATAIVAASTFAILQAVDGIALKKIVRRDEVSFDAFAKRIAKG